MVKQIDYEKWHEEFLKTPIGIQVKQDYPNTLSAANYQASLGKLYYRFGLTPREIWSADVIPPAIEGGEFSVVPFYYMNILQSHNPKTVIDLGCGSNMFKKYYTNIVGIDTVAPQADIFEEYNQAFIDKHYEEFESVICINLSWMWHPDQINVTYENFQESLEKFAQIIAPGGHCALSVSVWGMNARTSKEWFYQNDCNYFEGVKLKQYVIDQVLSTPGITVTHLDVEVDINTFGGSVDGDIKIVFQKNHK